MSRDCLLSVDQVAMSFGGIKALQEISFTLKRDSITALIGPNGAGKTTLFNCLTGFYSATKGKISFTPKAHPICLNTLLGNGSWASPMQKLYYQWFGGSHQVARAGIARTFQNIRLFKDMSVIENLLVAQHRFANRNLVSGLLGLPAYRRWEQKAISTAYRWLDAFKLADEANRLAGELPYGKQRHLEIARALCTEPTLLCLDEPAAGLNPQETAALSEIIVHIRDAYGITILLIEHDMSMVMKISDHIIVLDDGYIIATGLPEEVHSNPKVIEAYLG